MPHDLSPQTELRSRCENPDVIYEPELGIRKNEKRCHFSHELVLENITFHNFYVKTFFFYRFVENGLF